MKYLPPFEVLKSYLTISNVKGELMVTCSYESLVQMLRQLIIGVQVDEAWYLERYPDIAEAISQGVVQSPRVHFGNDGYFEGRLPFPIAVDNAWYQAQYPDVADSVRLGAVESPQTHFEEDGYREGRLPFNLA